MDSFRTVIGDQRSAVAPAAAEGVGEGDGNPLIDFFGHFPTIEEVETCLIEQAMARTRGNQGMAAKLLGMGRQTLNKRLKKQNT